jgi:hypothetical protein
MVGLLSKWPLLRQIRERKDGTGLESMSDKTRAMRARIDDANVARSICPYCGVGCGQLIYHKGGKLISIEGDPESPISQGNLCPKGAASYQLLTHSRRETKLKYRAPRAKEWTEISLDRAAWMNCANGPGKMASLLIAASTLPVDRSRESPAIMANQSLGHQSGRGKFPFTFLSAALPEWRQ